MKSIAFFLFPDLLLLDVAGPMEVFSIANRFLDPEKRYQITSVAFKKMSVRASNGFVVQAGQLLDETDSAFDLLLIPGGPGAYDHDHGDVLPTLSEACRKSSRYGSICTGAFILGEMGLLDGRRVATHWNYTQRLAKKFPHAIVEPDEMLIDDSGLLTSGGVTAGIDLALSVVAEDHGKDIALQVAKIILVSTNRQGGQAQFSPLLRAPASANSSIAKVQQYILDNLHESFCIEKLAAMVTMSPRNFVRVFGRETQMTPTEFVQKARIDNARRLLEASNLPIKTVAFSSGFGSVRNMRLLFDERFGVSPSEYRQQFG
jgi:transcriptional regulator GlxA family with amidase domain